MFLERKGEYADLDTLDRGAPRPGARAAESADVLISQRIGLWPLTPLSKLSNISFLSLYRYLSIYIKILINQQFSDGRSPEKPLRQKCLRMSKDV